MEKELRQKENTGQGITIYVADINSFVQALQPPEGFKRNPFGWNSVVAESLLPGTLSAMATVLTIPDNKTNFFELTTYFTKKHPMLPLHYDETVLRDGLAKLSLGVKTKEKEAEFGYSIPSFTVYAQSRETILSFDQSGSEEKPIGKILPNLVITLEDRQSHSISPENVIASMEQYSLVLKALLEAIYMNEAGAVPSFEYVFRAPERDYEITGTEKYRKRQGLSLDSIGGQKRAVEQTREIIDQLKHPDVFTKWGAQVPKGVLLVGPPGNGKTLLAKAIAVESHAFFDPLNLPDILRKWLGETEEIIHKRFEDARHRKGKTIIFLDEIDGIGRTREKMVAEWSANFLLTLTQEWDGIRDNNKVLVLGATNREEDIDPALRREGRFDILISMPNPDLIGIEEILNIHAQEAAERAGRSLFGYVDMQEAAIEIENKFSPGNTSGAKVTEILNRVLRKKAHNEVTAGIQTEPITIEDFRSVIDSYETRK